MLGGLVLEGTGWLRPSVRAATISTGVHGLSASGFAVSASYPVAAANGLRVGGDFTFGLLGAAIGADWSLGLSAAASCVGTWSPVATPCVTVRRSRSMSLHTEVHQHTAAAGYLRVTGRASMP